AIDALRFGGRFCFFGIFKEDAVATPLNKIIFNGGTFYGINGRIMFDTWFTVNNLLKSKRLNIEPVITHKMPMKNFEEAFHLMMETPKKVGKVVMFPDEKLMNGR
ncbi:MAG TPA: L-threonine 3-dehydrogenase, partial [Candidatus Kapabacteria bacterium]|nr:L-threonine 3-dehydrogenase [Candidatus Kapabacteria bacterium]